MERSNAGKMPGRFAKHPAYGLSPKINFLGES
jgi:hypothetical protein